MRTRAAVEQRAVGGLQVDDAHGAAVERAARRARGRRRCRPAAGRPRRRGRRPSPDGSAGRPAPGWSAAPARGRPMPSVRCAGSVGGDDAAADAEDAGVERRRGARTAPRRRRRTTSPGRGRAPRPCRRARRAAARPTRRSARGRSAPSSTTKALGTRTRPCPTICFLSAASRCRARRHLDRLDDPAEDTGEGTLDEAFEPTLEALEHSHAGSPSLWTEIVSGGAGRARAAAAHGC